MAFHEVQFPDNISRGARGGPQRRTQIVELASGREERNASWSASRRRYDVSYGMRRVDDLHAVVGFFEARLGRLYGFRFKDWADYKSCAPSKGVSEMDQLLGIGDGTTTSFVLTKAYGTVPHVYQRRIEKPVAGTIRVALSGAEQFNDWSSDPSTGIVTFEVAPDPDVTITAGYQFDVPVRFDSDLMDVTLDIERLGSISSIPLIEIRLL